MKAFSANFYFQQINHGYYSILFNSDGCGKKQLEIQNNELDSLKIISNEENEICVSYEKSKINIEEIINLIKKENVQIYDISTDDGDLEDVFLLLTKN